MHPSLHFYTLSNKIPQTHGRNLEQEVKEYVQIIMRIIMPNPYPIKRNNKKLNYQMLS